MPLAGSCGAPTSHSGASSPLPVRPVGGGITDTPATDQLHEFDTPTFSAEPLQASLWRRAQSYTPDAPQRRWLEWMCAAWRTEHPLRAVKPDLPGALLGALWAGAHCEDTVVQRHANFLTQVRRLAADLLPQQE